MPWLWESEPRFIPTHVGNTELRWRSWSPQAVHPHACGEHARGDHQHPRAVGSSPRMWGTRRLAVPPDVRDRFIPTHVGNTSPLPSRASGTPVHPHACGEHRRDDEIEFPQPGSSPRMWGTLAGLCHAVLGERFIPTHVGNTFVSTTVTSTRAVHPHACGEHWPRRLPCWGVSGSSPRMWGTP